MMNFRPPRTNGRLQPRFGVVGSCFLALFAIPLYSKVPDGPLTRFTFTEYHMGEDTRIVVYAPDKKAAEDAGAAAYARIAALDSMMSDYRANSELMRLSDTAFRRPVKVSPELFKVLRRAQEISRLSGGLFDVTVGPLVQLWRKARKTHVLPPTLDIQRARLLVGWRLLKLDERHQTVRLAKLGMRLDLGAIAKGYAGDEAQVVLKEHGIRRAMVDIGDIVVSGPPPGTKGWTVRVPNAANGTGPADMKFANCAISSSGDTEQFVDIGGIRYSHVVNPLTGQALTNRVQSTVVAPNGLTSDPLSTCMTLMSKPQRERLLRAFAHATAYVRTIRVNTRGR